MRVVSNTSPITNLAAIGRLDLLKPVFGSLCVPEAVAAELVRGGKSAPGRVDIAEIGWISIESIRDRGLATSLALELDDGEAEAIALGYELKANLVLMDERRGRHAAQKLGLKPLGLLGILVLAKRRGLLQEIRPVVDDLIQEAGFWIGRDLYERVLREVSEI